MPELPEVQTVIDSIRLDVKGHKIISCELFWRRVIYNISQDNFNENIIDKYIMDVSRYGKYIIFNLNHGYMLCHLRMTGSLYVNKSEKKQVHDQAIFKLKNKSIEYLHFKDIRKFGGFYYYNDIDIFKNRIGVDPFDSIFSSGWLFNNLRNRKRQIKHLLLDQKILCGLGNIYIDEILWASKIHPKEISNEISERKINILSKNIIRILEHSIQFHGTSIKDFTYDNLRTGEYRKHIKVFNRVGGNCYNCKDSIIKIKVAGRGTHICPSCQNIG